MTRLEIAVAILNGCAANNDITGASLGSLSPSMVHDAFDLAEKILIAVLVREEARQDASERLGVSEGRREESHGRMR